MYNKEKSAVLLARRSLGKVWNATFGIQGKGSWVCMISTFLWLPYQDLKGLTRKHRMIVI